VIARLDAKDGLRAHVLQMVQELDLLGPRPDDQDIRAILQRLADLCEEGRVALDLARANAVGLVMQMGRGEVCGHYDGVHAR
jgi:hypothetical protein